MFILIHSVDMPGGLRRDSYMGIFPSRAMAEENARTLAEGEDLQWRNLSPGSGPFESYCCSASGGCMKPLYAVMADINATESLAILEYGS